ncbi:MAG: lysophospholipase [Youngiibacter sp.]|nr:lysophospholipase [Youngiibacter sp.]
MKERIFQSYDGTGLFVKKDEVMHKKAVVLIVHGLCEHLGRYDYLTEKLNSGGYSVYRFDHRGHGKSEGKRVFYGTYNEIFEDVNAVFDLMKSENPGAKLFVVGHSMGGYASALFGSHYPGKADGYVLSGALTRNNAGAGSALPADLPAETYFPNELGAGVCSDPEVVAAYQEDPLVEKQISAGLFYTIFSGIKNLKENPGNFSDPVYLMHGCDDGLVSNSDSREFFGEIASKDKSLKIYSKLYHEIFNEVDKDEVISEAIAWLDKRS